MVDVLGTWMVSILDGQRRYAHIAGLRGDEVALQILGMKMVLGDDSLRSWLPTEFVASAYFGTTTRSEKAIIAMWVKLKPGTPSRRPNN
ncbi:MAG: hypothetical protein KF778_22395 [Rhodocyclaceae bacterium]|nr:hypothetical protein [Rhodocyclaceae bacterium]